MRLPTNSPRHQVLEDARQVHEALYAAYLDASDGLVFIAAAVEESAQGLQLRICGNLHRFWLDRGYTLMSRQSKAPAGIWLWLHHGRRPRKAKQDVAA